MYQIVALSHQCDANQPKRRQYRQKESWPAGDAYETSATLPTTCLPDGFEPDNNVTQARALLLEKKAQRNLCEAGDPDWFRVDIGKASDYSATALSISGGAAVYITVYAADGATILADGQAAGVGQAANLGFQAATAGSYYIKIEPLTPNLMGTEAVYELSVMEIQKVFLPLVPR